MFDVNTASIAELTKKFPELGKLRAEDIVAWREDNGPLADGKILTAELGFPSSLAKQIAEYIHVPGAPAEEAPTSDVPTDTSEADAPPIEALEAAAEVVSTSFHEACAPSLAPVAADVATASENGSGSEPEAELVSEGEVELLSLRPPVRPAPPALPDPSIFADDQALATSYSDETPVFDESAAALPTSTPMLAVEAIPATALAVSQTALVVPSSSASAPSTDRSVDDEAEPPAPPVRSRPKAPRWLVGAIIISNAALAGGLFGLRREEQQARAPVAAMSVEVKSLHSQQNDMQAQLEDTRHRLDQQASTLAKTVQSVAAVEERQQQAERAAADSSARQAKEVTVLTQRVNRLEHTVDEELYTVEEAIKIIQSVRPLPARPANIHHEDAKSPDGHGAPAH